jgi:hypothetical protein
VTDKMIAPPSIMPTSKKPTALPSPWSMAGNPESNADRLHASSARDELVRADSWAALLKVDVWTIRRRG